MQSPKALLIPVLALFAGSTLLIAPQVMAADPVASVAEPDASQRHAMSTAFNISEAFSYAAEQIEPSVVHITTRTATRRGEVNGGLGSGVIVDARGYILTNNHVVENGNSISVRLYDGRELPAELIGTFAESDVAVVKVEADDLKPARFGDSEALKVGQWVLAVGSPFGFDQTVTAGIVSAKGRGSFGPGNENLGSTGRLQEFIQTDAAINPGNSGGPLVDLYGNIVGINTAIISRTGSNNGLGFAIPADIAQSVMEQIIETGDVQRGWLGIAMDPLDPVVAHQLNIAGGVVIGQVLPDGPAQKAGLVSGDIITAIGGRTTENLVRLSNAIMLIKPNEPAEVRYIRNGDERTTSAIVIDRDREIVRNRGGEYLDKIGIGIIPAVWQRRLSRTRTSEVSGFQIVDITAGSPASEIGFVPGDFIFEVDGKQITQIDQLSSYFEAAERGQSIRIEFIRDNQPMYANITPK
ncbi:MAG: trypsin-like peptidase domain-containing protein [Phycisphaerales bacterium]|nr:trypsin-like peptidase domain-containing protein [Phycisphaerales bacterium]